MRFANLIPSNSPQVCYDFTSFYAVPGSRKSACLSSEQPHPSFVHSSETRPSTVSMQHALAAKLHPSVSQRDHLQHRHPLDWQANSFSQPQALNSSLIKAEGSLCTHSDFQELSSPVSIVTPKRTTSMLESEISYIESQLGHFLRLRQQFKTDQLEFKQLRQSASLLDDSSKRQLRIALLREKISHYFCEKPQRDQIIRQLAERIQTLSSSC
jgi:hypothetical protein